MLWPKVSSLPVCRILAHFPLGMVLLMMLGLELSFKAVVISAPRSKR